jgi:hypothetical protein
MNEDYGSQISKFRHQTGYCKRHSVDAGKYLRRMSQHSHEPDSVFVLQVADLISSDTRINQVLYFQLVFILSDIFRLVLLFAHSFLSHNIAVDRK